MNYWLIKLLLLVALLAITYFLMRPAPTDNRLALRRLGLLGVLGATSFGILFPSWFNRFSEIIGVDSGTNLLLYLVVVTLFAQMAASYRREVWVQKQITTLTRALALEEAEKPGPPNSQ